MENIQGKADFLKNKYIPLLNTLDPRTPGKWGKMNVQQMIEHMSDYVRIANGKTPMSVVTEADKLPRMQGFLASEKPFPENTPNVLMPETPPPVKHLSVAEAIAELSDELETFFDVHNSDPAKTTANPFFGELAFEQQVQLLYKHSAHHLRQFGVELV